MVSLLVISPGAHLGMGRGEYSREGNKTGEGVNKRGVEFRENFLGDNPKI